MKASDFMRTDFLTISKDELVTSFIGQVSKTHAKAGIVLDEHRKYMGITQKRKLYKVNIDLSKMRVEKIIEKLPSIDTEDSIERIAHLMYTADSRILAVTDQAKKVKGIVDARDLINEIKNIEGLKELRAMEVATTTVISLHENENIAKAIATMKEHHINRLPILDEKGELTGIVSFRDIMKKFLIVPLKKNPSPWNSYNIEKTDQAKLPLSNIMIHDVKKLDYEENVKKVIQSINEGKGSHVILMNRNVPVGIITPRDLLETYLRLVNKDQRNIQFIGLPDIDEIDRGIIENAVSETYDKMEKILNNIIYLVVHVKTHSDPKGLRTKYTVNARLSTPGILFNAKDWDWKLISTIQKALDIIERNVIEEGKRKQIKSRSL